MAKQQTDSPFNQDEFQRIFDEYRSKIEQITRSTEHTLESLRVPPMEPPEAEEPAAEEEAPEEEPAEREEPRNRVETPARPSILRPVQSPPPAYDTPIIHRPARPVSRDDLEAHLPESQKVIREARKQAQRILEEAEKQARKEARKKTKSQADKILAKARKDAEEYAEKARQAVEEERATAINAARTQAEVSIKEMTEHFREQARTKSTQIVAEAQARADRLMSEVTQASAEVSRKVNEVVDRAKGTITEFEEKLKSDTEGINQAIADTQSRIEALALAAAEEAARAAQPQPAGLPQPVDKPTMFVRVLGERSNGRGGSQPLFFGMVEIAAPPETCDFRYFKAMKRHMMNVPGVKQLQESASEKEVSALFDVTEPLPLLDILGKLPQIGEVISRSDRDIALIFNP